MTRWQGGGKPNASDRMRDQGIATANGEFGADMAVSLLNDGPVTIWLDTAAL